MPQERLTEEILLDIVQILKEDLANTKHEKKLNQDEAELAEIVKVLKDLQIEMAKPENIAKPDSS